MGLDVTIREVAESDRPQVLALVREAFRHHGGDGSEEVEIVRETWALGAAAGGLDLVAVDGHEIVGHVLGAHADVAGARVVGVAPLAVAPARQGQGVGSALVHELLARADAGGVPLVALLGSPDYYGRLGFEPAGPHGIVYRPVGVDSPHFQLRRLAAFDGSIRGAFTYCWEAPPADDGDPA